MVGLGVTAAAFIIFALASSFLFPRFRPNYPGRGLPAFIVVCFIFFVGMLTAVEVFGAEESEGEAHAAETTAAPEETTTESETTTSATTTEQETTTAAQTTTAAPQPQASTVDVTETEFKIALASTQLKAGKITFDVSNNGAIPHDLAIEETDQKTKEIPSKGSAKLTATLKPGTYELYCSIPGHKEAGMDIKVTVG
jgi:uncharacterized cupredoxin-like copper-binding protein